MQVTATKLRRLREIETAVRGFRWLGVVFALVQIGVMYQPPQGVTVPFPRFPVAAAFAVVLVLLNVASRWVSRSDDERTIRTFGWTQLAIDTLLVFAIVALFAFDDESRLWPLYVLPILEGALREEIVGAVGGAVAALVGNVVTFVSRYTTGELLSSTAFQAGILLILAVTAGSLARRFEEARRDAERQAGRLRELAEQASTLAAARETSTLLLELRAAACDITGLELCEIHVRADDGWRRAVSADPDDPDLPSLVDGLLTEPRFEDVVVLAPDSPQGRSVSQLLLAPIGSGEEPVALLVLATTDPGRSITETDEDLIRLLVGHAAVAMDNARIAEAEARTIADLQALDAVKDEFVHILAHELKAPMTAMTGYAALLKRRWEDLSKERREEFLDSIERGTNRLARLVSDVQEVTLAERDDLPVHPRPIELAPLVTRIAEEEVASSEVHRLELALDAELPLVDADPDRVAQVLHNLLSNAVKYSPDGGLVRVDVSANGEQVEVAITDDGFGIPPHLQQHLFRKFSRLPTPEKVQGTGLGLYLSHHLIEAMGGTIEVRSVEGRGSTFRFTLPRATTADERAPTTA